MGETLFTSTYQPDPKSALRRARVRADAGRGVRRVDDPDELEAVAELLGAAKAEAIERWQSLRDEARPRAERRRS